MGLLPIFVRRENMLVEAGALGVASKKRDKK